jgi:DNA-binding transcriptional LysR family regulator
MKSSNTPLDSPSASLPIDLRRLQVFVCSAKHLSFAACAKQLGLTPSAVSHAIRSLEEELACVLFQRHGPRVTLSRAGIRLLPIAEDLLVRVHSLRGEISSIDNESRQLRVGVPEFLCASLFPKIMPDFLECFPSFAFETKLLADLNSSIGVLENNEVDLVISIRAMLPGDLVRRKLFTTEFEFLVAPFHRLAGTNRINSKELSKHRLLVPHESILEVLKPSGILEDHQANRVWVLPSLESVREFAKAGMGIAVIGKQSRTSSVQSDSLQALSCSWPRIEATCSAFWLGQSQLSWAAEAFLSFVEMTDDF